MFVSQVRGGINRGDPLCAEIAYLINTELVYALWYVRWFLGRGWNGKVNAEWLDSLSECFVVY